MEISNGTWEKVLSIFWEASKMYSVFLGPIVKNKNKIIQQHQNLKEMKKCIKPNIRYSEFLAEVEHPIPMERYDEPFAHLCHMSKTIHFMPILMSKANKERTKWNKTIH